MRATLRLWVRATALVVHLVWGLALALALRLDVSGRLMPEALAGAWSRRMLRIFGIRLRVQGAPLAGARLTVANHVSWLDIPLLSATQLTRFVAKSEIRDWPVAGTLAEAAGTLFIRRSRGGARPLLDRLVPHLQQTRHAVTLFPEGTTTDGSQVLPFHARLFAAAQEAGCPVQPVALRYGRAADGRNLAPFIGDDDLVSHILRLLREPALEATLIYCEALAPAPREQLAVQAHAAICAALDPHPVHWPLAA
ncbi:MAG TPA: lysophospholipid acyltransferase family protein [Solimonas sp.]|nr:lysophospholipid acyltransferase family protein [Solimonas sp.]